MKVLLKNKIKNIRWFMFFIRVFRAFKTNGFFIPVSKKIFAYGFFSKEISSFTYELTSFNEQYLIQSVAIATNKSANEIESYFHEVKNDVELKHYVLNKISVSKYKNFKDQRCDFGSRVAWYAIVRATKARIIIENGIEIGYTAILLCRAIQKNIEEGYMGKYCGFDIDTNAGYLVKDPLYEGLVSFFYGDTVESILKFNQKVDFYFSDGARTPEYERVEFNALLNILCENGIIASNKMTFSSELAAFSKNNNRKFIYFKEDPEHWYPGSGLGLSFV